MDTIDEVILETLFEELVMVISEEDFV